jgi:hypothetical protein
MRPLVNRRPTRLIVVYGYGCDVFSTGLKERRRILNGIKRERKKFTAIDVMCNDKHSKSMTANIRRRLTSSPLPVTAFVREVLDHVTSCLDRGEKVTLVGHSYGGSVVSRVAIELKKRAGGGKVPLFKAITLGSIFIPSTNATEGVNVRHYVYDNDIARVCHKRGRDCDFVKFLKPKNGYGMVKSHMDYDAYITGIATTGSTNLNAITW